jgi:RNA polymerase sigma factor (sigma-70 family)
MTRLTERQDQDFSDYVAGAWNRLRLRAFRICHDWDHAADLVQSALTVAYKYWGRLEGVTNRDAYVTKIMVRFYIREIQPWSSAEIPMAALPEPPPGPALEAEAADDRVALVAALRHLGPRQRTVLVLRFLADLQVEDTAQMLMCGPSTVRSQSTRALNALRNILTVSSHDIS